MGRERSAEIRTAQADAAYESHVHHVPVTKTSRAEIHSDLRRAHQVPATGLVRQKGHHQVLQQTPGVFQFDVGASGGVGCLLQEDGIPGNFRNVDGNAKTLASENCVHDGDVLVGEIAAYRENEDAREEGRRRGGGRGVRGRC